MIVKSLKGFYIKSRPRPHRLEGIVTRQHPGYVVSRLPAPYPITRQQQRVRQVAAECNIRPGISRRELVTAMRECVGPRMRRGG